MAEMTGQAFAELPELTEIGGDFEGYVLKWEKQYGGANQAAQNARDWFDETLEDKSSTYVESFRDSELTWGKMFHFEYDPVTRDRLSYFDNSPMIISLGTTKMGHQLGMNLNFLPKVVRYWMVGQIFQIYEPMIIAAAAGKLWRRAYEQEQVEIEYELIKQWLGKYGLDFCIRQYHINKMKNLSVICYEDWIRMVMIDWNNFEDTQESELKKLYEEYLVKAKKR